MQLTKNFDSVEFNCPHCNVCQMDLAFVEKLQLLRTKWGKPIKINSGYRCKEHNDKIGGATDSQHVHGLASDIDLSGMSASDKYFFIALIFQMQFKGIGIAKNFIHIDQRKEKPATWTY